MLVDHDGQQWVTRKVDNELRVYAEDQPFDAKHCWNRLVRMRAPIHTSPMVTHDQPVQETPHVLQYTTELGEHRSAEGCAQDVWLDMNVGNTLAFQPPSHLGKSHAKWTPQREWKHTAFMPLAFKRPILLKEEEREAIERADTMVIVGSNSEMDSEMDSEMSEMDSEMSEMDSEMSVSDDKEAQREALKHTDTVVVNSDDEEARREALKEARREALEQAEREALKQAEREALKEADTVSNSEMDSNDDTQEERAAKQAIMPLTEAEERQLRMLLKQRAAKSVMTWDDSIPTALPGKQWTKPKRREAAARAAPAAPAAPVVPVAPVAPVATAKERALVGKQWSRPTRLASPKRVAERVTERLAKRAVQGKQWSKPAHATTSVRPQKNSYLRF